MMINEHATARVHLYSCSDSWEQQTAHMTVRDASGVTVELEVPFTATRIGETPSEKYAARLRDVIAAMSKKRVMPYGERGWEVAIYGGEVLIGSEMSASYSGIADHERIDLAAFQKVLEDVCSDPSRIWVHELYEAEKPR